VVSLIGSFKVKNSGYVVDDLPETDPVYMDLKFFERNLKGTLPFEISIDTKAKDGVKDYVTLQKINRLEKELYKIPEFSKPMSVVDVLKFANQGMNNGDERYFMVPNVIDISNIVLSDDTNYYVLDVPPLSALIDYRPIVALFTGGNKIYDGTLVTGILNYTLSGIANNEVITISNFISKYNVIQKIWWN
jgi:predicted RND superfamily exporter protein